MNELDLMTRFRDEVPVQSAKTVERAVLIGIREQAATPAAGRRVPTLGRARVRPVLAGALAVAVGAGTYAGVALSGGSGPVLAAGSQTTPWSGRPTAAWPASQPSFGPAKTEAQLIDFATRAAALAHPPRPNEWVVVKAEYADSSKGSGGYIFGPVDERKISLYWLRGDRCAMASIPAVTANLAPTKIIKSKLTVTRDGFEPVKGATCADEDNLAGWKSIAYSYLSSLPTDPAVLEKVILENNPPGGLIPTPASAVFDAIDTLLTAGVQEGRVAVPPKLQAALYRVLQQLPGVHFQNAVDLAGRTGLGFYMVTEGYLKEEIVIDPLTYAYMGFEDVAVKDHAMTATDGTRYVQKGHVMGWAALLGSAVVQRPGQLP